MACRVHTLTDLQSSSSKPQLINFKKLFLLAFAETVQVTITALVGGEFKFPENTVLVSAVYAVTVYNRLLKPLRLEMQHCVDLTCQPGLSKYLKFAIAPRDTPSSPGQFRIIEGGEFSSDSRYGSIERKELFSCLVCILGEETTKGVPVTATDEDLEEEQEQQHQGQKDNNIKTSQSATDFTVSATPLIEAKNKSEVVTKITKLINSKYVHIYK